LKQCIKVGTFGLSRKNVIGGVQQGDRIICCAGKGDWKIIAKGTATSDYYNNDEPVFLKEGLFIDRFDFEARSLSSEIDLLTLLDKLSFVTNLAYWAVYFRNGIVKISTEDWMLLVGESSSAD
jgi:hypothetical protein